MPGQDPRTERRTPMAEPVQLSTVNWSVTESTFTQDMSSRGARVTTQRVWQPGTQLTISSLRSDFSGLARVVYWRSFSSSRFAIGLEFLSCTGQWPSSG